MKLADQVHEACLTKHYSPRNGAHFLKMFSELQALEIWFVSLEFFEDQDLSYLVQPTSTLSGAAMTRPLEGVVRLLSDAV